MAKYRNIIVTPTVTVGAYSAGDAVGECMTFANAVNIYRGTGRIVKVIVTDMAIQSPVLDLFLYNAAPSVIDDNDAYEPTDADLLKCLGAIHVAAADWIEGDANGIAWVEVDFPFAITPGTTSIYGQLKVTDTPTFAAVNDVAVTLVIER